MKASTRSRRRQRHYKRMHRAGGLNLVSMMDIFTILVFFLMINSSDVKVVDQSADIQLPVSVAKKQPEKNTLRLEVTAQEIVLQGQSVAQIANLSHDSSDIPSLKKALDHAHGRMGGQVPKGGLPITIVADRSIPYAVLKRIMQTCVDADYRQVKLAVQRQEAKSDHG